MGIPTTSKIDEPVVVVFTPADIGEIMGPAALAKSGLSGSYKALVRAVVEGGKFKEIVVRLSPDPEALR